ncbi:hypothetical protein MGN70_013997 [Eutypa lata]|nr:hypothetical protein MGN70_013997 [Eutypa lata]
MAIAPKRVLLGGAAAGGLASRAAAVPGIPRQAAAAAATATATALFSTAPSAPVRLSSLFPSRPRIATSLSQRQAVGGGERRGVRWSSDSAPAGSKIWNFEEVQNLTSSSSSSSPTSKAKVTIIDVREPGEVAQTGRIPGSLNVPMTSAPDSFHVSEDEFEDRFGFARPDPADGEVLFYCKAGVRSRAAAGIARDAGWTKVGEYPGSWLDWVGRGGKVER